MKLSEAGQYARLTEKDWEILSAVPYGLYVEVGTHHGASACAAAQRAEAVYTIDVYDWQPKLWDTVWPDVASKITFFKGTSRDFVESETIRGTIDVLFIDGSHEYDYVLMDCKSLVPLVKKGGTVLFHDHNPNNPNTGVFQAVNEYLTTLPHKAYPKVAGASNLLHIEIL